MSTRTRSTLLDIRLVRSSFAEDSYYCALWVRTAVFVFLSSLGLNFKFSRWSLHLGREADEENEKSEKNEKNEKHLSGCLLGSRRQYQWIQRTRTRTRTESDAAKTTTAWESSQCVYARKSLRGAPLRPPNLLFQMSQEDNFFRRPQRWVDQPDDIARKKGLGLRLTRFDSVDGNLYLR